MFLAKRREENAHHLLSPFMPPPSSTPRPRTKDEDEEEYDDENEALNN
jgi:hypothetical protein